MFPTISLGGVQTGRPQLGTRLAHGTGIGELSLRLTVRYVKYLTYLTVRGTLV